MTLKLFINEFKNACIVSVSGQPHVFHPKQKTTRFDPLSNPPILLPQTFPVLL